MDEERRALYQRAEEAVAAFCAAAFDAEDGEAEACKMGAQLLFYRLDPILRRVVRPTAQMPCMTCGAVVRILPFVDWVDCEQCGTTHSR
jgi:hypothetical protein